MSRINAGIGAPPQPAPRKLGSVADIERDLAQARKQLEVTAARSNGSSDAYQGVQDLVITLTNDLRAARARDARIGASTLRAR